jgi:hypothetical protein
LNGQDVDTQGPEYGVTIFDNINTIYDATGDGSMISGYAFSGSRIIQKANDGGGVRGLTTLPHEIGHNLGCKHGGSEKTSNTGGPGDSIMSGGHLPGPILYSPTTTENVDDDNTMLLKQRFGFESNTGHLAVSHKHWMGWIEDENVVFMHPDGADAVGCAHCVTSWSGKINTYDRPDVVPGQTAQSSGSDIFAVKVHYALASWDDKGNLFHDKLHDHVLYIYFRTGSDWFRHGVSVQYCFRSFAAGPGPWAGIDNSPFTYDAHGATSTFSDSTILPGTTYVVMPSHGVVEHLGYKRPNMVLPRIRVDAVSGFEDCTGMICPVDKDISAQVSIDFVSPENARAAASSATVVTPSTPITTAQQLSVHGSNHVVDVYFEDFKNPGGIASITITACPVTMHSISLLVYDQPPLSSLLPGTNLSFPFCFAFPLDRDRRRCYRHVPRFMN